MPRSVARSFTLVVNGSGIRRASANLQIENTAPGIFTQNTDGKGVPAALVVRVAGDGSMVSEPVYTCVAGAGSCQPAPIDLGVGQFQVYLLLFGTGIRNARAITEVSAAIGGISTPVSYAGPQGQFVGLDQVNLVLPGELARRGTVDLILTVNSKPANTVQLNFR